MSRNSQNCFLRSFAAAGSEDLAAVGGLRTGQKTVLGGAMTLLGLESTFHSGSSYTFSTRYCGMMICSFNRRSPVQETTLQISSIKEMGGVCQHFFFASSCERGRRALLFLKIFILQI